ncbi:hypothetical protein BGX26_005436, partial [Mortierella sp. AD094]
VQTLLESLVNPPAIRVDVLGCCFMTIRRAYESHPDDNIAHGILEREIAKFGPKELLEKRLTTAFREERRKKSLEAADRHMDELEKRNNAGLRLRKHHFANVTKNLSGACYWSREKRQQFAQYMRDKNWNIIESPTEADLHIARDCQPTDVVVSRDSDLLIYRNVTTVWRPISKGRFLVYGIDDILATLKITWTQLTVLGVVSRNDYNKNIRGLGAPTNFSIVKRLCGDDPATMVQAYLDNDQVILKNTNQETFSNSIKVFINGTQTPMQLLPVIQTEQGQPTYNSIKARFRDLCEQQKNIRQGLQSSNSGHGQSQDSAPVQRHRAGQKFNRYRYIDTPPPKDTPRNSPLPKDQPSPQHRPRYSEKRRTRRKVHEPPQGMKQYKWKTWTAPPPNPKSPDPATNPDPTPKKKRKTLKKPRKAIADMNKRDILYNLAAEHPMTTLNVGTLSANVEEVLGDDPALLQEALLCIREGVRLATTTKRQCQQVFGLYLEHLDNHGATPSDRVTLDYLCPRLKPKNPIPAADQDEQDQIPNDKDEEEDAESNQRKSFLEAFLRFLYSGNYSTSRGIGLAVDSFIQRLEDLRILKKGDRQALNNRMDYTPTDLVHSIASQLSVEFGKMYKNGTYDIAEKLQRLKNNGQLPTTNNIDIDPQRSAIENFLALNKLLMNKRRIAPMSSHKQLFVDFSELQLVRFFWKREPLKKKLQQMAWPDYPKIKNPDQLALQDVEMWLGAKGPGFLIKHFVSDVAKEYRTKRERGKAGYKAVIRLPSLDDIKKHLEALRQDFNLLDYSEKGYFLSGTIRTDGFRIQLLAYKVRELQAVRFKRLPEEKLPARITSTVGGIDYYLSEIRNIIKTKDDVARLWPGCDRPEDIQILGLDLGQTCVVGASALLPDRNTKVPAMTTPPSTVTLASAPAPAPTQVLSPVQVIAQGSAPMTSVADAITMASTTASASVSLTAPESTQYSAPIPATATSTFHNLAVKQKAVYQSTLKLRHWTERQKRIVAPGTEESISDIECRLPPLRGEDKSIYSYVKDLERVQDRLETFYNGGYKQHAWDAKKARDAEFA